MAGLILVCIGFDGVFEFLEEQIGHGVDRAHRTRIGLLDQALVILNVEENQARLVALA